MAIIRKTSIVLFLSFLIGIAAPAWTDEGEFEYQVVILQGIAAGGTLKKLSSGIFLDRKKTEALSVLAAEGWEVLSVVGSGADDTVYLRRRIK